MRRNAISGNRDQRIVSDRPHTSLVALEQLAKFGFDPWFYKQGRPESLSPAGGCGIS